MSPWDNDSGPHTSWALSVPRSSCPALQPGLNRCFQTDVPAAKHEIPGMCGRERTSSFYVNIRAWFERTKPAWSSASRLSELPSEQGHRHTFLFLFLRAGPHGPSLGRAPRGGFPGARSLRLDWGHHLSHSPLETASTGFSLTSN